MSALVEALESLSVTPHVRFAETIPISVIAQQDSELPETGGYGIDCAGNRIKLPVLSSLQFASSQ